MGLFLGHLGQSVGRGRSVFKEIATGKSDLSFLDSGPGHQTQVANLCLYFRSSLGLLGSWRRLYGWAGWVGWRATLLQREGPEPREQVN